MCEIRENWSPEPILTKTMWALTQINYFGCGSRTYQVMQPVDMKPRGLPTKPDIIFYVRTKEEKCHVSAGCNRNMNCKALKKTKRLIETRLTSSEAIQDRAVDNRTKNKRSICQCPSNNPIFDDLEDKFICNIKSFTSSCETNEIYDNKDRVNDSSVAGESILTGSRGPATVKSSCTSSYKSNGCQDYKSSESLNEALCPKSILKNEIKYGIRLSGTSLGSLKSEVPCSSRKTSKELCQTSSFAISDLNWGHITTNKSKAKDKYEKFLENSCHVLLTESGDERLSNIDRHKRKLDAVQRATGNFICNCGMNGNSERNYCGAQNFCILNPETASCNCTCGLKSGFQ